ncbi:MAG: serine/threonine protein kinase, partial [Anaerolineae bacterium]|nr:serine/threonine protein kinase [Anaerolineae bacterium]
MLSLGATLQGRYRVDRMLDIGAMEARYRGWDQQRGEPIFIRELSPQPDLEPELEASLRTAFTEDAAALVALDHPHIVRVIDAFICSDGDVRPTLHGAPITHAYLIQQAVAGQGLADLIAREGTLREARVVVWARDLLDALSYAHGRGVIHKDLRPEAILITSDDRALLTNFEITALWNPGDPHTWTAKRVMGVPQYAPPESWGMRLNQIDARSDIYSLGATLYHALTGEQPLTAGERTSNPYQFLQVKALAPRVRAQTKAVILKAMELPPDKRYQTAAEMRSALEPEHRESREHWPLPAPFLPRRRAFAWSRVWGLLVSILVLFSAGLLGLWVNQVVDVPRLFARATREAAGALGGGAGDLRLGTSGGTPSPEPTVAAALPAPPSATAEPTRTPPPVLPIGRASAPQPPSAWRQIVDDRFD